MAFFQKRSRLTNLETATAATCFHSVILVFLSVHLLTGAFLNERLKTLELHCGST